MTQEIHTFYDFQIKLLNVPVTDSVMRRNFIECNSFEDNQGVK